MAKKPTTRRFKQNATPKKSEVSENSQPKAEELPLDTVIVEQEEETAALSIEALQEEIAEEQVDYQHEETGELAELSENVPALEVDFSSARLRNSYDVYHFFWRGKLSQWAKSEFEQDGIVFKCAEQYMMYYKAILMNDTELSLKILKTETPKEQQELGRKIKNFDQNLWDANKTQIVYNGNYLKFTQNPKLLKELFETGNTLLVEASPFDKVWGIGLDEEKASKTSLENWQGQNLLGKILTKLREDLESRKNIV